MGNIQIIDRQTGRFFLEKIHGKKALEFLYGDSVFSKIFLSLFSRVSFFSRFYGFLQKRSFSKKKILPFILEYGIDLKEFDKTIDQFSSFNDFFIRKLKTNVRPIASDESIAICPCDGRYVVFSNLESCEGFYVKGEKFSLSKFLQDENLEKKYRNGAMVIARLCPTDYHRFHFPFDCKANKSHLINGYLYSVNPLAIRKNIDIFSQNKKMMTLLINKNFGKVLYIEIGATNVGSIIQTFLPDRENKKGEEKGYFSFGGSSIILFFEENKILFDRDLVDNSKKNIETRCLFGQSLGKALD